MPVRLPRGITANHLSRVIRPDGQYHDAETGLYFKRFQYCDPDMSRYIIHDSIRLEGGNPTLYGYVGDWSLISSSKERMYAR
ncbi:MAG: hypothetical protein IPN71_03845 [Fibrobacteres bacterium]|nr:hypothetical protein [Fibrobacterota bacterium]